MKDFEFLEFGDFLEVADGVNTPFKFYKVEKLGGRISISAKVWLRTAYVSFRFESASQGEIDELAERLSNHGFNRVHIRETAIPIK